MGLSAAEALREQLLQALNADDAIEVDAGALEDIDVSVIQVLISAHKTATKLNRTFKLASPPNGVLADALQARWIHGCRRPKPGERRRLLDRKDVSPCQPRPFCRSMIHRPSGRWSG